MRKHWLACQGGAELTLVFGGWALGVAPFSTLEGASDVLIVDDYRDLSDELAEVRDYDRVRLLAFSFGVASVAHWLADNALRLSRKVAVNGTSFPADAERGIAPDLVAATADNLSTASFARFCRRAGLNGTPPDLNISAARAELRCIADRGPAAEINFDRVWISDNDRIIPTSAQEAAWSTQPDVVRRISGPHVPFSRGQSWGAWFE